MNVREALGFHVFERIIWHIRTPFISPASVWRAALVGHRGPIDAMVSNIAICRAYGREIGQNNDNAECLTKDRDALLTFYDFPAAHKTGRRLDGNNQLPKLILGVKFANGLELVAKPATASPQPSPPDRSGRHQKSA